MEDENAGLTTSELASMLLSSFHNNDGKDKFGFILSTYEYDEESGDYGLSTYMMSYADEALDAMLENINMVLMELARQRNEEGDFGEDDEDGDYDDDDDFKYN